MFIPGLVSVSFRGHSPEEIAAAASAAGLRAIEWGSDIHVPCTDIAKLREAANICTRYGLIACSYGTYYTIGENSLEEIYPYIDAAKILGTKILRLWCGSKGSEAYTREEREQLFADCRILAEIAEKAGIVLGMEYHPNTFTDSALSAMELMKTVDSPAFRMYWQVNHYRSVAENLEELRQLAPYVTVVHVYNRERNSQFSLEKAINTWKSYKALLSGDHPMLLEFIPDNLLSNLPFEASALLQIVEGSGIYENE